MPRKLKKPVMSVIVVRTMVPLKILAAKAGKVKRLSEYNNPDSTANKLKKKSAGAVIRNN